MIVLFDTSVLIAGFIESHSQHNNAMIWLEKAKTKKISMIVSAHSLAECYAVLTRLPLSPKISPNIAHHIISENILKLGKIVSLTEQHYLSVIQRLSILGFSGGIIYDAIILKSAEVAKAKKLLTLNPKDFIRICSSDESKFIISPETSIKEFS